MTSNGWSEQRIAGVAGIGFFILFAVVIALSADSPGFDDPAKVREFFVDSDTRVHLVTWLGALAGVFFFLPFAAKLRTLLAPPNAVGDDMWSRLSYSGAVLVAATIVIGSAFWQVLSFGTAETLSDDALVALARFDTAIFGALWPWVLALFLAAAAIGILRNQVLARWIGWFGAVNALLLLIGSLWIFGEDERSVLAGLSFTGFAIFGIWVLVVSIAMVRSGEPVSARQTTSSAGRMPEPAGADLNRD